MSGDRRKTKPKKRPYPLQRPERFSTAANPEWPSFAEKLLAALVAGKHSKRPGESHETHLRAVDARLERALGELFDVSAPGAKADPDLELFYRAFKTMNGEGVVKARSPMRQPLPGYNDVVFINRAGLVKRRVSDSEDRASLEGRVKKLVPEAEQERVLKRLQEKWSKGGYGEYFEDIEAAYTEEAEMLASLETIASELQKWGIAMNLDPVLLRLAALWDETT